MTAEATSEAKARLRQRVTSSRLERLRRRRAEAADTAGTDSDAECLAAAVLALARDHAAGRVCRVAAYESMPTEPSTEVLLRRLREEGYEVIVPATLPDRDLDWRVARTAVQPGGDSAGGRADVEPHLLGRDAVREARVVVVPALAADRCGSRLGRGGGSYDRALARCGAGALLVVLLHDGELLEAGEVPVDPHDVPVHVAVTPALGAVRLSSSARGGAGPPTPRRPHHG